MKWTDDQRHVIEYRNRNILVSAAAGSGKTAVLVERIMELITGEQPIDVDQLLVVTFTKAAAAEMRERIGKALEAKMEEAEKLPEETQEQSQFKTSLMENLQRQSTLIYHAQITTIDSFCLNVVRNHFGQIGLDPNFRIADQGEIKLLKKDTLDALFEDNYNREDNEAFLSLVDTYGNKRGDAEVRDMVESICRQSESAPWPKEWIESLRLSYDVETEEELLATPIMVNLAGFVGTLIEEAIGQLEVLKIKALAPDGPQAYAKNLTNDIEMLQAGLKCQNYKELNEFMNQANFEKIATIRKSDDLAFEARKEVVKSGRDDIKGSIKGIKEKYFGMPVEQILEQLKRMRPFVEELIRLSLEYTDCLAKEKSKKHIMDFSDIEHMALQILVDPETKEPSQTAREFMQTIEEIMIDEYQDSNEVQESILCAISRMKEGDNNMFMVGDVKQSIYRFRQARPELFMEKYDSYSLEESPCQRIDLKQNFRSRKEVLDYTNDIFYKIMGKDLGKVAYDSYAALYPGATYYPETSGNETEFLFVNRKDELLEDLEDLNKIQLEATMVASRISKLMEEKQVYDKNLEAMRPIRFSDIVILFRSVKNYGPEFATVLENKGIPVHVETSTGYFSTMEIQTVLAFLQILDNPYQDIPMAAVLKSPMVGLDNEELAEISCLNEELSFSENAMNYCKEAEGNAKRFWDIYQTLRAEVEDLPIHELIEHLLKLTGYGNYAASLPAGERRYANLSMLIEKAIAYEASSYKGLFHFVRYIETLKKYDEDFGEADVTGESANVVHIMTIHKSKGLEFPVVFVSGMGKQFDTRDIKSSLVIHPDLKLGLVEKGLKPRLKRSCLIKEQIANQIRLDNLGEELRILYVALTRAKEKLIVTGTMADYEKVLKKYQGETREGIALPFSVREDAKSYMDWLVPAMLSYPDKYRMEPVEVAELTQEEAKNLAEATITQMEMHKRLQQVTESQREEVKEKLSYTYPFVRDDTRKIKYSVSELKHASMEQNYAAETDQTVIPQFAKGPKEKIIPRFLTADKSETNLGGQIVVNRGALRGTAMHRAMECMNFLPLLDIEESTNPAEKDVKIESYVKGELERMRKEEQVTEEMAELIRPSLIASFMKSPIAQRMAKAQKEGNLFREKPFIMDYQGALVQGIIDVFWLEEDELVVLDYKTDRVQEGQELIKRYKTQLDLYGDALGRAFADANHKKRKTEALIYAFALQEVIQL